MNHFRISHTLVLFVAFCLPRSTSQVIADEGITAPTSSEDGNSYDVVIYGGTSAGIAAAVQVKRMGGSVVVVEPGRRIGGLTTGGLGQTDSR